MATNVATLAKRIKTNTAATFMFVARNVPVAPQWIARKCHVLSPLKAKGSRYSKTNMTVVHPTLIVETRLKPAMVVFAPAKCKATNVKQPATVNVPNAVAGRFQAAIQNTNKSVLKTKTLPA
jgi:hypothetical protein